MDWKGKMLQYVVSMLLQMLSPEMIKQFADTVLDFVEDTVAKSETQVDDKLLLPMCQLVRTAFNIPDND